MSSDSSFWSPSTSPEGSAARPAHVDLVGGLDGCRAGWVLATSPSWSASGGPAAVPPDVRVLEDLAPLIAMLSSSRMVAAAIDVPIGLPTDSARHCDVEARHLLGPRRSSVFPVPARTVLGAASYEEACELSVRACGKKISRQLFNILPKIQQVDRLITPQGQARLVEMCPELSFTVLTGAPMRSSKRTAAGRAERVAALGPIFGDVDALVRDPPQGAVPDDVLDALVGLWTAHRYATQTHVQLGGELDATGLRMEMVA
jgi:predicted RNase H-like nuclease